MFLDSQSSVFSKLHLQYKGPIINLGFIVKRMRGIRCRVIRVDSRVKVGRRVFMWLVIEPRWVMISMYRVYRAVISMLIPVRTMEGLDQENEEMMTYSSPIKLIDGGRAKLVRLASSHQVAMSGRID